MKSKTKSILLGLFVVVAIVMLTGLLLAVAKDGFFKKLPTYTIYYNKSVKGLKIGSPVMFRGVRIGQVINIELAKQWIMPEEKEANWPIEVIVEIDPESLNINDTYTNILHRGQSQVDEWLSKMVREYALCAKLQTMSLLTGQLYIEMNLEIQDPPSPEEIEALGKQHIIPTRKSAIDKLQQTFSNSERMENLIKILDDIGDFSKAGKLHNTLDNIHTASTNTAQATQEIKELMAQLNTKQGNGKQSISAIIAQISQTLDNTNVLLNNLNAQTPEILKNAKDTIASLKTNADSISKELKVTLNNIQNLTDTKQGPSAKLFQETEATLAKLQKVLDNVQLITAPESEENAAVRNALKELERAARSIRSLTDMLEKNPEALIRGK